MKNPEHVIAFDASAITPRETLIDDPAAVDTPYESRSWRHFENREKGAVAGIWQAGLHKERCKCDYDELCHILEGVSRVAAKAHVKEKTEEDTSLDHIMNQKYSY